MRHIVYIVYDIRDWTELGEFDTESEAKAFVKSCSDEDIPFLKIDRMVQPDDEDIKPERYYECECFTEESYADILSAIEDIRTIRNKIEKAFPKSRELSLAMTKLDEARLWLGDIELPA